MANERGLIRKVRLLLDRRSADKTAKDSQRALNKGTDPKKAEKNLSRIDKGFGRLRSAALKLGAAIGAAFAVRGLFRFGKESIRIAAEADVIWTRLGGTLETVGINLGDVRGEIDNAARAMQDTTTVGDEQFAEILQRLVVTSQDYAGSLENVQVVADLAAGAQIDLKTASQLVGRAMIGDTATLKRYGVVVGENEDAISALRRQFAGLAENEARSLSGQVKQLGNEWGDFRQTIGDALIEAGGGTSILETLTATLKTATQWVNENKTALLGLANAAGSAATAIGRLAADWVRLLKPLETATGEAVQRSLDFIRAGEDQEAQLKRLHAAIVTTTRSQSALREKLITQEEDLAGAIRDGTAAEITKAQRAVSDTNEQLAIGAALLDAYAREAGKIGAPTPAAPIPPDDGGAIEPDLPTSMVDSLGIADPSLMADAGEAAATAFVTPWLGALDLLEEEATNKHDAISALSQALAHGGLAGVTDLANAKARENLAYSLEEAARAAGAWATGNAPAATLHMKSAGEHLVAMGAWGALGASGVGGGGRGGGAGMPTGARDIGGRIADRQNATAPEVHVYIDPLDPYNPVYQQNVGAAARFAEEAYGKNARITVHNRTRTR